MEDDKIINELRRGDRGEFAPSNHLQVGSANGPIAHGEPEKDGYVGLRRDRTEEWDALAKAEAEEREKPQDMRDNPPSYEELGEGADGGGKRLNKGKTMMELTLPEWDWALADVSTMGQLKYDAWNWLLGMKWSYMIGCMKRHLAKFELGERYDGKEYNKELGTTGCHHLAMVAWNALALMSYDLRGLGEDDRATLVNATKLLARINAATSDMKDKL